MNSKRLTTTSTTTPSAYVRPNMKLNVIPPKIETKLKATTSSKPNDESLFSTNLTNIIQTEPSCNPSPMLKQNIMDILQILPESPIRIQNLPSDQQGDDDSFVQQPMQGLKLFQFNKQDQVENALKEQISNLKKDGDLKNALIEKLVKENNNLKNEIGELLAIELRKKRITDMQAKETAEKIAQLQEEIKSLKLELSNYKQPKTPKKNLAIADELIQLKTTIDNYHEDHSQKYNTFVSQLNDQVSEFMSEIQKKHAKLNNHIHDFKKVTQTKKSPPSTLKQHSQTPKPSHKNMLLHKDDRKSTPQAQLNRDFKKQLMLRSLRTFEFDDDDSKNNSTFSKTKCLTQRTDESFEFKSLI